MSISLSVFQRKQAGFAALRRNRLHLGIDPARQQINVPVCKGI